MDYEDLDLDPFEIHSWEDYCMECIKHKRLDLFKKKLSEYIYLINSFEEEKLKKFINAILTDLAAEELREQYRLYKPPKSNRVYKFV